MGIVWAGNPNHVNDSRRSMAFDDFACLLDIPNIRLVSLHTGKRRAASHAIAEQKLPSI